MEMYIKFKEEYEDKLNDMIDELKGEQQNLMKNYKEDEASFCRIKQNIIDIFYKMFEVGLKNTDEGKNEILFETYMKFFQKIPSEWIRKAELDKKNKMEKEFIVEELKINTAEEVKKIFISLYEKCYGGVK